MFIVTHTTTSHNGVKLSYDFVPIGKDPVDVRPGDLLFCHRSGFASRAIRFGEGLRFRGGARWSHVACCSSSETLVEALTRGVTASDIQEYRFIECLHVRTNLCPADQQQAVNFLHSCIGLRYGFLTDAAIGLRFITPFDHLTFGTSGTVVCSGLGAQMLCRGPYVFSIDPAYISPAQLAIDLGAPPRPASK